jgi:hypothetical protein
MQLSPNFKIIEFTRSYVATRNGIRNDAPPEVIENLKALCIHVLEPIRAAFQLPITVNSGYRNPQLNRLVRGAKRSQHLTGHAADIEIAGIPNTLLADWIAANLEFDQLIKEFCSDMDPSAGWIHVSYAAGANRMQVLTVS